MEKVQFQLEATLPELKDLYDKGLFSKHEIDQITKRRTQYETALIRRITRKEDFFRYAEYEINLERLRKVRWKKLRYHINPPPPSASTYSLPRRTLYILKRATAKFPGDLAVWLAYIEYAAREGMTKVVAKGLNSALQHHPLSPTLYLLLSYSHLHPGSPLPRSSIPSTSRLDLPSARESESTTSAFALEGTQPARTTLLLGLRVLPTSHTLWREYVKLELGWVEALRRRWHVLGINVKDADTEFDGDAAALAGGDGAFGEDGEEARKAILSGQLVVHALSEALAKVSATELVNEDGKVVDGIAFRAALISMLRSYPSPLRKQALGVIYNDLETIAINGGVEGAKAGLMLLTRPLYDREYEAGEEPTDDVVLHGLPLVDALGAIGKAIRSTSKKAGPEWIDVAGAWLADRTEESTDNPDLQRYLFSTLKALTKSSLHPPASFLERHLELVEALDEDAYMSTAASHAAQHPSSPALQLARVRAEVQSGSNAESIRKACADAAAKVTTRNLSSEDQARVISLWRVWAKWEEEHGSEVQWKKLLGNSLRLGAGISALHSSLLASYFTAQLRAGASAQEALDVVVKSYQPTSAFFALAFVDLAELVGTQADLAKFYRAWRAVCKTDSQRVDAVFAWAEWLVEHSKGRDAYAAVDVVRREVRDDESQLSRLEAAWKALLDEAEARNAGDVEMNDSEEEDMESDSDESGSDEDSDEGSQEGTEEGSSDDEDEDDDMGGDLDIAL